MLVLASTSPRRRELLGRLGIEFRVEPSGIAEDYPPGLTPEDLVRYLASAKAAAVVRKYRDAVIIAADTCGVLQRKILGKPRTPTDATAMLRTLSARSHRVITGLTVMDSGNAKMVTRVIETRVFIKALTEREIQRYVATGEPLDKAGGYAIQGLGAVIVARISGDYYNVMGLPLYTLAEVLPEFGVEVL